MTQLRLLRDEEAAVLNRRLLALDFFAEYYADKPSTSRAMHSSLRRIAYRYLHRGADPHVVREKVLIEQFPWEMLNSARQVSLVMNPVKAQKSKSTVAKDLAAVRVLLGCLKDAKAISATQWTDALSYKLKRGFHQVPEPPGRYLSDDDVGRLLAIAVSTDNQTKAKRNLALLAVGLSTGARRDEISSIQFENIDLERASIVLTKTKSGVKRTVWLHETAVTALNSWVEVRGKHWGPLFHPVDRFGRVERRRALSPHQIWKVIGGLGIQAGIGTVKPHDLRRFVVSSLLDSGHDLVIVARVVGHVDVQTTSRYDRRPLEKAREAISALPLPYPESLLQDGSV